MKKIILAFLMLVLICLVGCGNSKKIDELNQGIASLPPVEEITLDNEEEIIKLLDMYNILSSKEQEKIVEYDKLWEASIKIDQLNAIEEEILIEIVDLINLLPSIEEISMIHENVIIRIEELLTNLSNKTIEKIEKYDFYLSVKEKYDGLKEIKDLEDKIKSIIKAIDELPTADIITITDESKINAIRDEINSLSEEAQEKITNIDLLNNAENIVKFLKKYTDFDLSNIIGCISDEANDKTADVLVTKGDNFVVEWVSSNEDLYSVATGTTKISKRYQTHKKQVVTVSANITINNGDTIAVTKEVEIAPVLFEKLPDTPVATYFQTSALSSYKNYSDRYKEERTLFSDKAKEVLDIVYYAFANVTDNGGVYLSNLEVLNEMMELKNHDVRIILCISGVSSQASKIFNNLTANQAKRARFVSSIVDMVEKYNFDGVDIDWESSEGAYVVASQLNSLMKDLRSALDKSQDRGGSKYLLTAAIPATSWGTTVDRFDFATLNKYVDYINMMSYDLNNPDKATHLSALYSSSNDKGYGFSCEYGVKIFTARGLDKDKIIIGSAGYGKAYKITTDTSTEQFPGLGSVAKLTRLDGVPGSFDSGTVFLNGVQVILKNPKYKKYIEYDGDKIVASFLYNAEEQIFVTYDSEEVMSAKYNYAVENKGMGIMCWAYTEDTADSYINSIYDIMHEEK